jgi:hypothetical protein
VPPNTPPQPNNGVWISKEEYERLRQAEQAAPAAAAQSGAGVMAGGQFFATPPPSSAGSKAVQIAVGAAIVIFVYAGFVLPDSWATISVALAAIVVIIIGYSALGIVKARREHRNSPAAPVSKSFLKTLLVVAVLVVAAPFIVNVGLIVVFLVICSFGGCRGS